MTFQAQRFFSLSTSTHPPRNSASAIAAGAPVYSTSSATAATANLLSEPSNLELLVRASETNKMAWLNNNNNNNCVPPLAGVGGERPDNGNNIISEAVPPASNRTNSTSQTLIGGGVSGSSNNTNAATNPTAQRQQPQTQLGHHLFGGQWNINANTSAAATDNNANLAAKVNAQANVISQLVASLQAQQQAQLQVALARAFGTGVNPNANNTAAAAASVQNNGMNSMQAAVGNIGNPAIMSGSATTTTTTTQGGGEHQGIQGFGGSSSPHMNGSHGMMVDSMAGMGSSLQHPQENTAREFFSRVQLAQRVQQQQQQQQALQQQQAAQLVHQMQQQQLLNTNFDSTAAVAAMAFHPNNANTMNVASLAAAAAAVGTMPNPPPPLASSSSAAAPSSSSTTDELIKLQYEHEQHKRMLQLIQQQADRQDPLAILSSHGAAQQLMKRARWDINGGGAAAAAAGILDDTQACMNDAIKTMFLHQQQHSSIVGNTALAAAFPHGNPESMLTGSAGPNSANLMNAAGLHALAGLGGTIMVSGERGRDAAAAGATSDIMSNQHLKFGASSYGATIVPCRARGMPVDHNFKTAFFVVPENCEHGDELMCTYPSCRSAGVKFRYCLHCKVPVAKRNFRNRHRHGVMEDCSDDENDSEDEEEGGEETCDGAAVSIGSGQGGTLATNLHGDICQPVDRTIGGATAAGGDEDEDYAGVKKEHILIIPGVGNVNNPSASDPMSKKKKKGKLRVPCRARGLPMAHNFKSAYFIIPPNIEHGDELLCSFPLCRSAGAKFRYCLHCKVPVAKRNFRNRHKHGKSTSVRSGTGNTNEDDMQEKEEAAETLKDEDLHAEDEEKLSGSSMEPLADIFPPPLENVKDIAPVRNHTESSTASSASFRSKDDDNSNHRKTVVESASKVTVSSSHDVTEVQKWVEMLENKPDPGDKQAMAIWMANLMNATNGNIGSGGAIAANAVASSDTTTDMPPDAAAGRLKVREKIATQDEFSDLPNVRVKEEVEGVDADDEDIIGSLIGLGQTFNNDTSHQEFGGI